MAKNIDLTNQSGLVINNITDLREISSTLARSGYFSDAREAAQACVKVLAGLEMGVPAFAAMTGIFIVKGKACLSANIMAAIIKKSGKYDYRVTKHDKDGCCIEFYQEKDKIGISEFTITDATNAGL